MPKNSPSNVVGITPELSAALHETDDLFSSPLIKGGGGGTFDGMEPRVAKIEARLDSIDKSLERIESGLLTKWDMAQVVFFVVSGLMAAAIFGPRIASMFPSSP